MKTLILSHDDLTQVLSMALAIPAVEAAFTAHACGGVQMPPKLYLDVPEHGGDFRAMPSSMESVVGLKWVNSHPHNPKRHRLPSVMGVYILNEPANAFPLAILDGTLLTAYRTGAAAGVASRYLARESQTLGIIGCGVQAPHVINAHRHLFPDIELRLADANPDAAAQLARTYGGRATSLQDASGCDIVCTLTPSRQPVVEMSWLQAQAHINALGADAPGKQEIDPLVLQAAAVVLDDVEQATHSGEVNVALASGAFLSEQVYGTLGEIVTGRRPVPEQALTLFDSTGLALQDLALANAVYNAAKDRGLGHALNLVGV